MWTHSIKTPILIYVDALINGDRDQLADLYLPLINALTYIRIVALIGWTKVSTFYVTEYIYLNRA